MRKSFYNNIKTYKAAFIHLGKCAGTSIKHYLFENHINDIAYIPDNRSTAWVYSSPQPNIYYKKYIPVFRYKFTVVRNPFDRLVSFWEYIQKEKELSNGLNMTEFACFIESIGELDFNDYLKSLSIWHIMPYTQKCSVLFENGDLEKPTMDFVCRFEKLVEDLKCVFNNLDLRFEELSFQHKNKTKHRHYSSYYTDKEIEVVSRVYKKDLEYFNYKFEDQRK